MLFPSFLPPPGYHVLVEREGNGTSGGQDKVESTNFHATTVLGFVDGGVQECDEEWTCPLPENTAELLEVAADHRFVEKLYQPQVTDGLVLLARIDELIGLQDTT